ncbi:multidrug ABC transporter ATP-binding protein [Sulfolobales archaeon HS-7]|nr:multidrug ABC transporter ATP-binding protein [Sulfolobales archaeon HS-7]
MSVECRDVQKIYKIKGRTIEALKGITFSVKGGVTSIVGPNGAGKTTLIKILSTLIIPTKGEAYVNGYSVISDEKKVRESIGLVTVSDRLFYFRLTGLENLIFYGILDGLSISEARERGKDLMEMVGLGDWINVPYMKYSTGMQRKLALARALLTDPPVILLDEPTLGLDPVSSRSFRETIRYLSRNKSILMTSHNMRDVEELSNNIMVISSGKIVTQGSPKELVNSLGTVMELRIKEVPKGYEKYVISSNEREYVVRVPKRIVGQVEGEIIKEEQATLEDFYVHALDTINQPRWEIERGRGGRRWGF